MGNRQACLAILLVALLGVVICPGNARAKEARSVGYVLSFRLGVEEERAKQLVDEVAKATSDWLARSAPQGEPVAKGCSSSSECIRKAAAALGVSRLGIVAIVAAGGVVRIEVRLMDASTGGELHRTHTEYEKSADAPTAEQAIFDLMPRLLPGEKAAPKIVTPPPTDLAGEMRGDAEPVVVPADPPVVPPVTQIPEEPISSELELTTPPSEKASATRWWLWGGLGVATTAVVIIAAVLVTRDDATGAPTLELPPAP